MSSGVLAAVAAGLAAGATLWLLVARPEDVLVALSDGLAPFLRVVLEAMGAALRAL